MPTRPGESHRPADWARAPDLLRRAGARMAPLVFGPCAPAAPFVEARTEMFRAAVLPVAAEVNPISDFRASAEYRRARAGVLEVAWRSASFASPDPSRR